MAKPMSENSRKVFEYLKSAGAGVKFTTKEVMAALGFEKPGSVTGSVQGLVRKGLAEWSKETVEVDGKQKEVSYFCLNSLGAEYDPDRVTED